MSKRIYLSCCMALLAVTLIWTSPTYADCGLIGCIVSIFDPPLGEELDKANRSAKDLSSDWNRLNDQLEGKHPFRPYGSDKLQPDFSKTPANDPMPYSVVFGCDVEGKAKSTNSDRNTAVIVSFVNNHAERAVLYWLNYEGQRVFYANVEPGDSYSVKTYTEHPWLVATSQGQCFNIVLPQEDDLVIWM